MVDALPKSVDIFLSSMTPFLFCILIYFINYFLNQYLPLNHIEDKSISKLISIVHEIYQISGFFTTFPTSTSVPVPPEKPKIYDMRGQEVALKVTNTKEVGSWKKSCTCKATYCLPYMFYIKQDRQIGWKCSRPI